MRTKLPARRSIPAWIPLVMILIVLLVIFRLIRMNQVAHSTNESYQQVIFDISNTNQQLRDQVKELQKENNDLRKQVNLPIQQKVVAEVNRVFGKKAPEALLVAQCESGINPDRININKNGSVDHNLFQINDVHIRRFGTGFINDWKQNIQVAYALWKEQGWRPWYSSASCHHLAMR